MVTHTQKNKTTQTFSADAETKRMLNELCETQDLNRSQVLRRLIRREYEAVFSKNGDAYKIQETVHTLR